MSQAIKSVNLPTFILGLIITTCGWIWSYSSTMGAMEKKLAIFQIEKDYLSVSVNELKIEIKTMNSSLDDIKSAMLTNRKVDELKTLLIGSGIGKGQTEKILQEGLDK